MTTALRGLRCFVLVALVSSFVRSESIVGGSGALPSGVGPTSRSEAAAGELVKDVGPLQSGSGEADLAAVEETESSARQSAGAAAASGGETASVHLAAHEGAGEEARRRVRGKRSEEQAHLPPPLLGRPSSGASGESAPSSAISSAARASASGIGGKEVRRSHRTQQQELEREAAEDDDSDLEGGPDGRPSVLLTSMLLVGALLLGFNAPRLRKVWRVWAPELRKRLGLHLAAGGSSAGEKLKDDSVELRTIETQSVLRQNAASSSVVAAAAAAAAAASAAGAATAAASASDGDRGAVDAAELGIARPRPNVVVPLMRSKSALITPSLLDSITHNLPPRYALLDWRLLYSSSEHGLSLSNFYRRVCDQGPSILVIKDSKRAIFGGFVSVSWQQGMHYFGTGETFVMSLAPRFAAYNWTKANSYFALARDDCIALGGGDHFAIWLDAKLQRGQSLSSETFGNPTLSSSPDFDVYEIEVWGFVQ